MTFDPDAYAGGGGFDPDAYAGGPRFDAKTARAAAIQAEADKMPWLERQLAGVGGGMVHAAKQAGNLLGKVGIPGMPSDADVRESAEYLRPLPGVARATGGIAAALPVSLAAGMAVPATGTLGALVAANAALGAAQGGVFADPGERLSGAMTGGAFGASLPLLVKALGKVGKPVADYIEEKGYNLGRRALTGGKTPLSVKKPVSDDAVRAAYEEGAFRPLGSVKGASERLWGARDAVGQRYSDIIDALDSAGVTGPNAGQLSAGLRAEANQSFANSLGSPKPRLFRAMAAELLQKPNQGNKFGGDLGLKQAEAMKRTLQHEAATEYDKLLNKMRPTGEAKVEMAARMREAIEDAVTQQASKAPAEAAAFEPVKRHLSNIIEASNAANEGAARMAYRSAIGLPELMGASAGAAAGNIPGAVKALALTKVLRTRGPQTGAWAGLKLADSLRGIEPGFYSTTISASKPGQEAFIDALRRRFSLELQSALPGDE